MYRLSIVLASSEKRGLLGRQIYPVAVRMALHPVQHRGKGSNKSVLGEERTLFAVETPRKCDLKLPLDGREGRSLPWTFRL
jgi:hypothetical protein